MPYCITLRSKTDKNITGWYDGSESRWSTDHNRQKLFEKKRDAKQACHELRKLSPRNANVINIEIPNIARQELSPAASQLAESRFAIRQPLGKTCTSAPSR
jgi:hypothetical protein